jgi:hypothetical protein
MVMASPSIAGSAARLYGETRQRQSILEETTAHNATCAQTNGWTLDSGAGARQSYG